MNRRNSDIYDRAYANANERDRYNKLAESQSGHGADRPYEVTYTAEQFRDILEVDPKSLKRHIHDALADAEYLSKTHRARGIALLLMPQFREWIESRESGFYVVHANEHGYNEESFPSLSASVAVLHKWMIRTSISNPVTHFCGCYVAADESRHDPVTETLRSIHYEIAKLPDRRLYHFGSPHGRRVADLNASELCELLKVIMKGKMDNERNRSVTFLIDCANFLEAGGETLDSKKVMDTFQDLVTLANRDRDRSRIKVILFFPRHSEYAYRWAARDGVLEISGRDIERFGQGRPVVSPDDLQRLWYPSHNWR